MKKIYLLVVVLFLIWAQRGYGQITVTSTGGTGSATYTTLHAAVLAINAGTHTGVINVSVTANTTETVESILSSSGTGSASYTHITIKPATSATPTISGNITTALLEYDGADYVTIDGSNTVGGTTRDLTIKNTSTGLSTVIWISSAGTTDGATYDTVMNCNLRGQSASTTVAGILCGDDIALGDYAEAPNSYNAVINDSITNVQNAFYSLGEEFTYDNGWYFTRNSFTSLGFRGILLDNVTNFIISNNLIDGVTANTTYVPTGIFIYENASNGSINNNKVGNVNNTALTYGCNGIWLGAFTISSNINVYNNFIYKVWSTTGYAPSVTAGDNGYGIIIDGGGGYNLYYNTVNLTTTTTAGRPAAIDIVSTVTGTINLVDNIFANNQASGGTRYSIYSSAPNSTFGTIDYNEYYSAGTLGFIGGTARTTLLQIQAGFGENLNSLNTTASPTFVSTTDLHLTTAAANAALAVGTPITSPSITTDIDGDARAAIPTIGADEFGANLITYTALAATTCGAVDVALNGVSITSPIGVPVTGATVPQIYFQKNAGTWYHSSGTLASGTGTSGTWDFTISAATMGGVANADVITYYVIAQTTGGAVFSSPATGLVATDVNTVTTPPTTLNSYTYNVITVTGLPASLSVCENDLSAISTSIPYTSITGGATQYEMTWAPSGPGAVTSFATLPSSPIPVTVPAATPAGVYAASLQFKNPTTGCIAIYTATSLTVNVIPAPIAGSAAVCAGSTVTFTDDSTGSWSVTNSHAAIGSATGIATGASAGTDTVIFTLASTGCSANATLLVNPLPSAIVGSAAVCLGSSTTFTDGTTPGNWTTEDPSKATVTGGVVTGADTGTTNITYTLPATGCYVTKPITVEPLPAAITGLTEVCELATITLGETVPSGTWSSSNTNATVNTGGVVTGAVAGLDTIYYTLGSGCNVSYPITINPIPSAIVGPSAVCVSSTITLSDPSGTGTWIPNNTNAGVSSSGVVTGATAGTDIITFALPVTGCHVTKTITVNPLPAAITGTNNVCIDATVTLHNTVTPGTWTATNANATAASSSGIITGVTAGLDTIIYTLTTGCTASYPITVKPLPGAYIIPFGDSNMCPGETVLLTANTGSGLSYQWYNGTSPITGETGFSYEASSAATYKVQVTGSNSCFSTATIHVSVNPATATANALGSTVLCGFTSVNLSANTGSGLHYQWKRDGVSIPGATSSVYPAFGYAPGDYTVVVSNTTGCSATSTPAITVTELPTPSDTLTLSGSLTFCAGDSVILTGDNSAGLTYQWFNGTSLLSGATTNTYTAYTSGTYVVHITNGQPCTSTPAVNVTANPLPDATITPGGGISVFCSGNSVALSVPAVAGNSYVWYQDSIVLSGVITSSHTTTTGGYFQVKVTSAAGCVNTTNPPLSITEITAPVILPQTDTSFCWGGSATLGQSIGSSSGATFQWYVDGVSIFGATNSTYNASATGSYVVIASLASCSTTSTPVTITEFPLPNPVITYDGVNMSVQTYFTSYQWLKDGMPMIGATGPSIIPTATGSYEVQVTDTNGCVSIATAYPLTHLGSTGVGTVSKTDIKVYPNPATSMLHIQSAIQVHAIIYTVDGRSVIDVTDAKDIDISALADGVYTLLLYNNDGQMVKADKLVKG